MFVVFVLKQKTLNVVNVKVRSFLDLSILLIVENLSSLYYHYIIKPSMVSIMLTVGNFPLNVRSAVF